MYVVNLNCEQLFIFYSGTMASTSAQVTSLQADVVQVKDSQSEIAGKGVFFNRETETILCVCAI